MVWASMCSSSGEITVFMRHWVLVILCGWLSGTRQNNRYRALQKHSCFSSWWAHICPKHAEFDKCIKNKLCTKLALFTRLYRDAWSIKYKISINIEDRLKCFIQDLLHLTGYFSRHSEKYEDGNLCNLATCYIWQHIYIVGIVLLIYTRTPFFNLATSVASYPSSFISCNGPLRVLINLLWPYKKGDVLCHYEKIEDQSC